MAGGKFDELELAVDRARASLLEAQDYYERTNIETRQIRALRAAEDRLTIAEKNLRVARETGQRIFEQKAAAQSRIDTLPAAARDFITAVQRIWPGAELVEVRKYHKGT